MILPLFPLRVVLFPGMMLPLHIFEPRYRDMINRCVDEQQPFGVVLIQSGAEVGSTATPHPVGTTTRITRLERLPDGRMNIETVGQERFRIQHLQHDRPYLTGQTQPFPLAGSDSPQAHAAARALHPWVERYLEAVSRATQTPIDTRRLPLEPAAVAFLAAIVAQIPLEEKQALLELPSALELLERERALLRREVSLVRAMSAHPAASDDTSHRLN